MQRIDISVQDNIATNYKNSIIVCNNNNYRVYFQLDKEWSNYKTLIVKILLGEKKWEFPLIYITNELDEIVETYIDLPPFSENGYLLIGLYDKGSSQTYTVIENDEEKEYTIPSKQTTTGAKIQCVKSINNLDQDSNKNNYGYTTLFVRQKEDGIHYLYEKLSNGEEVELGIAAQSFNNAYINDNGHLIIQF